jgi:hypothetical protein
MQTYLDQKRSMTDQLHLIRSPTSDVDLQLYILHGLSIKYDSLIISLNYKSGAVPFNELAGLLLTHEQRIQRHALTPIPFPEYKKNQRKSKCKTTRKEFLCMS